MNSLALLMMTVLVGLTSAKAMAAGEDACQGRDCQLYVHVSIAEQLMYVYVDGELKVGYQVSTGADGHETSSYQGHPIEGRIYDRYMSKKFPGADYYDEEGKALGNMPYAMFFFQGQALHGTPQANWGRLGSPDSHGCVRMYPDQAKELNRMVREFGVKNTWFNIDRERVGTADDGDLG